MHKDTIDSFRGHYAFLSNFYTCRIPYLGMTFSSVESAFQAAKCANPQARSRFQYLTARDAKREGRTVSMRPDWEKVRVDVLLELLFIKFGSNPDLMQQLLATGDVALVEGNTWHDNFGGNCTCGRPNCSRMEGKNMLGQLLMSVRATYRRFHIENPESTTVPA